MNEQQEIQKLWEYGRFRDPRVPDAHNVAKADLPYLTFQNPIVRDVLAMYQSDSQPIMDEFTALVHGRACNPDGERGPATAAFMEYPRCRHPDFPMTPEDDPAVAALWNPEEANWPDACRREILIGRNFDALPGLDQANTDKVYHAIANNWTAAISDVEMTPRFSRTRTNERMFHRREAMSGSTLAYHYLARNRCDDWLDGAWNSNVNWAALDMCCATGSHECGHGIGLNHVNDPDALLYYAITPSSRGRFGYVNSTDVSAVRALGYTPYDDWAARKPPAGKLFIPRTDEPPEPEPPTDPDDQWRRRVDMQLAYHEALIRILLERTSR